MVRILHAADFHLDSAFTALTEEQARHRRRESRAMVQRLCDYGNDHGAQLLVLPGDLFDSDNLYGQTAELVRDALASFGGQVVIAPGNHDYYTAASPYARLLWPENVHIFTQRRWERLAFPQYGCTVYGAAFTGPEERGELPCPRAEADGLTLGVIHGEAGVRESRYRPISLAEIEGSGLTYLALGHVHRFDGVHRAGKTDYAYPGCPEGRGFDETGERGFLFGDVDESGAHLEFVSFAAHRYELLTVDITDSDPVQAVGHQLPPHTQQDIYRIVLEGESDRPVDTEALQRELAGRFYALEMIDRTNVRRDIWEKCGDDTLRGLFLQQMRDRYDREEDEASRAKVAQAVRFALDAMDNRER